MNERQLRFRVGLFVIFSVMSVIAMVFYFGELAAMWKPKFPVVVHFDAAPGVYPGTPVRRNGITIGVVKDVKFDEQRGGVLTVLDIDAQHRLRADAEPRIIRSLLGDSSIEFTPGKSPDQLVGGDLLKGSAPPEPMEIIARLESSMQKSLSSLHSTSEEWRKVGQNVNSLVDTNRGDLDMVIERTAESLAEFTIAMRKAQTTLAHADSLLADPQTQQALRDTLQALPQMVAETRDTIRTVKLAVSKADSNLANLELATRPLGERTAAIATRLDNTLANLESVSQDVKMLTKLATSEEGSLQKFVTDPELYNHLNQTAASMAILSRNLEPVLRDLRIFSDKVARHPELMGVGGALTPSSGVKDPGGVVPAAATAPAPQRAAQAPPVYRRN